jgi:hypothetical protein
MSEGTAHSLLLSKFIPASLGTEVIFYPVPSVLTVFSS